MRKLLAALAFLASFVGAQAQDIGFSPQLATPAAQLQPDTTLDFAHGVYAGSCTSAAACLSAVRASTVATDLVFTDPPGQSFTTYAANTLRIRAGRGILKEDNRTNFLLNSGPLGVTTPATQTTGSLANGAYVLWVNAATSPNTPTTNYVTVSNGTSTGCAGSGTGTGAGQATQGLPLVFTATGGPGTCVITVSGTLNEFQLELSGSGFPPTSFIPTTGATVARGTETITPTGTLATDLSSTTGYALLQTQGLVNGVIAMNRRTTGNEVFAQDVGANTVKAFGGNIGVSATPAILNTGIILNNSSATSNPNKFAVSWGANGISTVLSQGALVHNATQFNVSATNLFLGGGGTANSVNYFIPYLEAAATTPGDIALRNGTRGWANWFLRFVGDSITVGFNSNYPYPGQMVAQMPGGGQAFPLQNLGVLAIKAVTIVTNWPTTIAPIHDSTIPNCADFIFAGTNDIVANAGQVPATEAALSTLYADSRGQGCLPIAISIIPRGAGYTGTQTQAQFELDRQAINTWIPTQIGPAGPAAFVNLDLDPVFQGATPWLNACSGLCFGLSTFYNADLIHPNQVGDYYIAKDIAAAMSGILY